MHSRDAISNHSPVHFYDLQLLTPNLIGLAGAR